MTLVIPDVLPESCATRQALERLAAKWRVLLIYALLAGPQRPAALRRRLPGITQKVLTETLRGMVADALVERRGPQGGKPPNKQEAPPPPGPPPPETPPAGLGGGPAPG